MTRSLAVCCLLLTLAATRNGSSSAAEPSIARRIPPTDGIQLPDEVAGDLRRQLQQTKQRLRRHARHPLESDIRIFTKAVGYALRHGEFYREADIEHARDALREAARRLEELDSGAPSWTRSRGLVVRGYSSSIDGSAQPYGLEIPAEVDFQTPVPLYVWLHGRGDKLTDLHFIQQRMTRPGKIQPRGAIVVHPFGRHCLGFKSAGEIDVLDVVEQVRSQYPIDPDRIVLIGFSMGGAGAWHIGAHYADRWAAVSPGAGFAETARYNRLAADDFPAWYEQKLWGMYDVPDYVRNLFNVPTIAYSGEKDRQIQAARVMEAAFREEGRTLPHLIGPGVGHEYQPETLAELLRRLEKAAQRGRDRQPEQVFLQTRTLRYGRMHWIQLLELDEHWLDSRVDARRTDNRTVELQTRNVHRLRLAPLADQRDVTLRIDGQELHVPAADAPRSEVTLHHTREGWVLEPPGGAAADEATPVKRPGLQGPIDDVFLEPFLVVTPGGKSSRPAVERWVNFELDHFRDRWRALFRGDLREKRDDQVTEDDLARYHVILWGDLQSNRLLRRAFESAGGSLPIGWRNGAVRAGDTRYDAATHVPVFIYPNPLNPRKYMVVNSGPTFRESHDRTNSLQNPKLPDWAVLDLSQPPSDVVAGRVAAAGFFDERWRFKAEKITPRPAGRPGDDMR